MIVTIPLPKKKVYIESMLLSKSKTNIFYLCLLVISLRLVGCAPFEDNIKTSKLDDQPAAEKAPIIDLNATQTLPKSAAELEEQKLEDSKQLSEQILTTESEEQAKIEQQEPEAPVDIWQRLRDGFEITPEKLPYTANKQLNRYLKNPHNLNILFKRSTPYLFHVTEQLENANLPLELALLPIVESNYDPLAYSPSHAVGLWQFIPSTATSLGLERSRWYEGRRDVVQSTAAAATYLAYLNKQFSGNWMHALAAYNSGEGAVRKAIRKNRRLGKTTDFWSLRLPRETKNYVPQLMALASIVKDAEKHQIKLSEIENNSVSYEKYSIRITAEIETYFAYEKSKMKNIFIENSYACSPAPPKTDEKITNIEIYTNNDYNSMNQSGQNINQLFDVLVLNHFSSFPYYEKFDLIEYINTNPNIANELIFVLKEAPENNDNFIFEIKYYQNGIDLNEYSFVTNEIGIRKE